MPDGQFEVRWLAIVRRLQGRLALWLTQNISLHLFTTPSELAGKLCNLHVNYIVNYIGVSYNAFLPVHYSCGQQIATILAGRETEFSGTN